MLTIAIAIAALTSPTEDRSYDGTRAVSGQREDVAMAPAPPSEPIEEAPVTHVEPLPQSEPEPEPERPWLLTALVDTGYAFNHNTPDNHIYRGTSTHPRTGEFTVNLGLAALSHAPTPAQPYRFEFGVQAGSSTDALVAAEPVPGEEDGRFAGAETWKHLAVANAGGRIEASGTELGAGLFGSPIGIGGFWTPLNDNVSPSWESNAAPFYFAGARVLQDLPAGFGLQAWIVNGWQTLGDANKAPSYLLGATWARDDLRTGSWNANAFAYFGPDGDDLSPEAWRWHLDANAGWEGPRGGVAAVWDYGQERRTDLPGEPIHAWSGGGVFTHLRVYDGKRVDVDLAARPDAWYERGDRIYGVDQWLLSGTATAGVFLWDHLRVRIEYRYDHSTAEGGFFYRRDATADDSTALASNQHTVFFNVAGVLLHAFAFRPSN